MNNKPTSTSKTTRTDIKPTSTTATTRKARDRTDIPKSTVERHMPTMYAMIKSRVETSQGRRHHRDPRA